jgi:hypothetical protein
VPYRGPRDLRIAGLFRFWIRRGKIASMKRPRFDADHPDYGLELQEALESDLQDLIDRAFTAGWLADEIWPALRSLATSMELAARENRRTDEAIAAAVDGLAKKH